MLNSFKNKAAEQDKSTAPHGLEFVRPQRSVAETVTPRPERAKSGPDSVYRLRHVGCRQN